ncbi:hypothetical protein ACFCZ2_09170 [Streptomyces sp. NPDC056202]|uniref:hypothetical protein n=1 Tax=Streptomyces sp. NPDC056202 TaxID=3345745 RepID=UPI0035D5E3B7
MRTEEAVARGCPKGQGRVTEVFVGRAARLVVSNEGEMPLDLMVEPWGDVHRILSKETCVVVTHSFAADGSWPGTPLGDEPFQIDHRRDSVTVWANGHCFHLSDREGNEIDPYVYGGCPAQGPAA